MSWVRQKLGVSRRRACRVLGQARSTERRHAKARDDDSRLVSRMAELAERYGRYGYGGGYPGYTTATRISPKEKVGVIVFTNALDGQPYSGDPLSILDRVFNWVAPAITKALADTAVPESDASWNDFEGTYRTPRSDIHVLPYEGRLIMIDPTSPNPKETAFTLEPVSQDTFKLEGKGYWELGEPVVFQRDKLGKTSGVKIGENTYVRVNY